MVKHLMIALDDKEHNELTKFKDKKELTWKGVLLDWMKRVKDESH